MTGLVLGLIISFVSTVLCEMITYGFWVDSGYSASAEEDSRDH
jgi:hypothetical protein